MTRRHRRYLLSSLAAAMAAGIAVAAALADAPDPKVAPQAPSLTVKITHDDAAHTTTVTVTGGWVWTTHSTDCNTDRAGVGSGGSRASERRWGPISHVYENSAIADGVDVCAIMYEVHKGQSASQNGGVGVPGSAKEITAGGTGHNGDNGAEDNKNTPLGNACVPAHVPPPPSAPKAADLGTTPALVRNARVAVNGNRPTGKLTFELFGPDDSGCSGTPAFRQTVQVSDGTAETANDSFVASAVGTWRWRIDYAGDANNLPETSPCGLKSFSITSG